MTNFELALINRDGISEETAKLELKRLQDFIESSGDLTEIEEFLMDEYGLESDDLLEIVCD
jgi:hypothetical protein